MRRETGGIRRSLWAAIAWGVWTSAAAAQPAVLPGQPQTPVVAADSASAKDVLARSRGSVIQIRVFFGTNAAPFSHGSGFSVGDGVFMTNYHVVSDHVDAPKRNRLEYRTSDGAKTGALNILAIDVRNDLALVKAADFSAPPLQLRTEVPAKGDRAFSVGFPLDVGLTITEGVANGLVEDTFQPRIHYSGAVNGGMSGGPAFNAAGDVIGINVSGYLFRQSVAFLVPAAKAAELLAAKRPDAIDPKQLKADIATQMRAHSTSLLDALDGPLKTERLNGYLLPAKLSAFFDCNASGNQSAGQPYETVRSRCDAKASVFLQRAFQTGDMTYTHVLLSTTKLGPWRFTKQLSNYTSAHAGRGYIKYVGPLACQGRDVQLKGFDANVYLCTREHRKLAGLHDFVVRVVSLNGNERGFASHLDMFAVDFDKGLAFIQRYLDAMAWEGDATKTGAKP